MATAADLHNQIAAAKKQLEEKKAHTQFLREESTRAEERQKLRRQLEEVQKHISHQERLHVWTKNWGSTGRESEVEKCAVYLSHSLNVVSFIERSNALHHMYQFFCRICKIVVGNL